MKYNVYVVRILKINKIYHIDVVVSLLNHYTALNTVESCYREPGYVIPLDNSK